ncbi:MAG: thioredoxin [Treponema sp.]|nr:thioredoxin [Treponema sp.]
MSCLAFTNDNFDAEVLKSPVPVLVDFWAPWCGPCKMIGPVIEQIAGEYQGRLKVGKVNVDDNGETAQRYNITSIPSLMIFKNGEIAAQKNGAAPKHEIESLFKNLI